MAKVGRHAACQMQDFAGLGSWGVEEQVAGSNLRHLVQVLYAEDYGVPAEPQARAQLLGWEPVHEPPGLWGPDSATAPGPVPCGRKCAPCVDPLVHVQASVQLWYRTAALRWQRVQVPHELVADHAWRLQADPHPAVLLQQQEAWGWEEA